MADFHAAYNLTSKFEGGYVNDPDDTGGETYAGISRNNWPQWIGWEFIDKIKRHHGMNNGERLTGDHIEAAVESFYKTNFWDKIKGDQINNQSIANIMYDWYVNSGYHAIQWMQKVVGVTADGVIGPKTLQAINAGCQEEIFKQYKAARINFYHDIVKKRPAQRKFLSGWLNRTNDIVF